jgi:hypothetical protein
MQPLPEVVTDIDCEWLTGALRAGGVLRDARVRELQATLIGEGAGLTGQLARLEVAYDESSPELPSTLIIKGPTLSADLRAFFFMAGIYAVEAGFYRDLASRTPLRTPRCYFSEIDPAGGRFILLLEDLAPARPGDQLKGASLDEAELAVTNLARLHAAFWGDSGLTSLPWLRAHDHAERLGFLQGAFPATYKLALAKAEGLAGRALREVCDMLLPNIGGLAKIGNGQPPTLLHGDFRLDNLMFGRGPAGFAAVDWQLTTRGPGPSDLAYFLTGSLRPADRRAWESRLMRLYCDELAAAGVSLAIEECERQIRAAFLLQMANQLILTSGADPEGGGRIVEVGRVILERMSAYCEDRDFSDLLAV